MDNNSTSTQDYYSTIFAKQFSPCGNYLAAGSNFGKISVFNIVNALTIDISINSKLPVNVFQAHERSISCFASTERYLISGGSTEIHGFSWKDVISLKVCSHYVSKVRVPLVRVSPTSRVHLPKK